MPIAGRRCRTTSRPDRLPDFTREAVARSGVESVNAADTDFPRQNLPFGRLRRAGTHEALRVGVAIGDQVLDLAVLGRLDPPLAVLPGPLTQGDLNGLMARGRASRIALRHALSQSGAAADQGGSLREPSHGGRQPITLGTGEMRSFLQDGYCVVLRGHGDAEGARRIGFDDCAGTLLPAVERG